MEKHTVNFENMPQVVSQILAKVENMECIMNATPPQQQITTDPEPYIYGLKGLAEFLHISTVTANRIKQSGKIPFSQAERTIIFNKADVLKALQPKKK